MELTLAGEIVLTIGCDTKSDEALGIHDDKVLKAKLDALHLCKIRLADRILVINVGGYVGESTSREIAFAIANNKGIDWLEEQNGRDYMARNAHTLGAAVALFAMEDS